MPLRLPAIRWNLLAGKDSWVNLRKTMRETAQRGVNERLTFGSVLIGISPCFLCVLWASVVTTSQQNSPQRPREHKGCTEKKLHSDF